MKIELDDSLSLTAIFIPSQLSPGKIVINEINYNSHDSHDTGDWIELFNAGEAEIDITNWVMKDDNNDHAFILSENTIIESGGYFIIAQRPSDFLNFFVSTMPLAGPFNFGLSGGGDEIRIFNDQGMLIDSVKYDDSEGWFSNFSISIVFPHSLEILLTNFLTETVSIKLGPKLYS